MCTCGFCTLRRIVQCATCLVRESECSFMLWNVYEDRNIEFDIMKTILMPKKKCFDFSNLLSSDFVRSMSHYLIVQVTWFLTVITVLRYNIFPLLILLLCTRFSKFNKSGEADVFRLGLKYLTISGRCLIHLEPYCKKLPRLC